MPAYDRGHLLFIPRVAPELSCHRGSSAIDSPTLRRVAMRSAGTREPQRILDPRYRTLIAMSSVCPRGCMIMQPLAFYPPWR